MPAVFAAPARRPPLHRFAPDLPWPGALLWGRRNPPAPSFVPPLAPPPAAVPWLLPAVPPRGANPGKIVPNVPGVFQNRHSRASFFVKIRSFSRKSVSLRPEKRLERMRGLLRNTLWLWMFMLLGSTNLLLARSDAEPLPSLRPMALVSCSDTAPGAVGELLPAHEESLLAPRLQGALPAETSVTHTDHKSLQALRLAGDRARLRSIACGNTAAAVEAAAPFRPSDYYVFTLRRILV